MPERLCSDCHAKKYGEEPDLGEDDFVFEPGECTSCGKHQIVFFPVTW